MANNEVAVRILILLRGRKRLVMCDVEYEAREGPGEALGKVRGQVEQKLRHVSIA